MKLVLLFFSIVFSHSVPKTRTDKEIYEFYKLVEENNLKVLNYEDMGFGLASQKDLTPDSKVLCIGLPGLLYSNSPFPLSDYIKDFSPFEKLVMRVLYEKFMETKKSFYNDYINSLPHTFESVSLMTPSEKELFSKLILHTDLGNEFDRTEDHERFVAKLKKIKGISQKMLSYNSFLWAYETVISRMLAFTIEEDQVVIAMSPLLDLLNHWPNPSDASGSNILADPKQICFTSMWQVSTGHQIFIDYGEVEPFYFFLKYKFVPDNPRDVLRIVHEKLEKSEYRVQANKISLEIINEIFHNRDQLGYEFTNENIENLREFQRNRQRKNSMVNILIEYKKYIKEDPRIADRTLIRQLRQKKYETKMQKLIIDLAIATQKSIYKHLQAVDRELLYSLHSLIF